jgi:hypothetical protein
MDEIIEIDDRGRENDTVSQRAEIIEEIVVVEVEKTKTVVKLELEMKFCMGGGIEVTIEMIVGVPETITQTVKETPKTTSTSTDPIATVTVMRIDTIYPQLNHYTPKNLLP